MSLNKMKMNKKTMRPMNGLSPVLADEAGQGLTEYIVLLLLVCVVSITTVKTLGSRVKSKLAEASNHINSDITLKDSSSGSGGSGGSSSSSSDDSGN